MAGNFGAPQGSYPPMTSSSTHAAMRGAASALLFLAATLASTGSQAQNLLQSKAANNTSGSAASSLVQTAQVRAELVAYAPDGIGPGKDVRAGLRLQHQPGWHTYWLNPGDSGLATSFSWTLPSGLRASDIEWPAPQRLALGSLANYGYEGEVLLPVTLTVAPGFKASADGTASLQLDASWLVCRQECIPQQGRFSLQLPLQGSTAIHGAEFARARQAVPALNSASAKAQVQGNALLISVSGLPANWQGKPLLAAPESERLLDGASAPFAQDKVASGKPPAAAGTQVWNQGQWSAYLPLSAQREGSVTSLPLVLRLGDESVRLVVPVRGSWPALADAEAPPPPVSRVLQSQPLAPDATATVTPLATGTSASMSWLLALASALLGGLILNLMPCVLPVLAIKVLGFSRHADHSRALQRAQGLAYSLGVVLSFVALGALMLALRATGEQLGWGFQLQSPAVLAVLAALFTLLGLNLCGLFEIGSVLPHRLAGLQIRHPVVDSFVSGMLAVAIASPCTAPFMGASLGYAIGLPAAQALGIFAALGLGLALPFLLISWLPWVGRWLPQPGAWMSTLRRFMAFPMFATVVWLVWVLGHLSGMDGAAALLALLLGLSLLVWALGLPGRSRLVYASLAGALLAVLGWSLGPSVLQAQGEPTPLAQQAPAGDWQAWSPTRVSAALASGRPVFVDFTAAWCITCQYNKKNVLNHADVVADMRAHQVTRLRADWTHSDPAITAALAQLGRNGVPVYVLYHNGHAPQLFSEILDRQELRNALAQL